MATPCHLYVFDGYADWEPAFAVAGIGDPAVPARARRWRVRTVAERLTRACARWAACAVRPDVALEALQALRQPAADPAGRTGWDDRHGARAGSAAAQRFLDAGVPVAAICGATAGLARSGRLDARPHTSNALSYLKGTGYAGAESYVDEPAVSDGVLITAGGMAPLEFAREIFVALAIYDEEALESW
jgi:putative intracellular protease/amidase